MGKNIDTLQRPWLKARRISSYIEIIRDATSWINKIYVDNLTLVCFDVKSKRILANNVFEKKTYTWEGQEEPRDTLWLLDIVRSAA